MCVILIEGPILKERSGDGRAELRGCYGLWGLLGTWSKKKKITEEVARSKLNDKTTLFRYIYLEESVNPGIFWKKKKKLIKYLNKYIDIFWVIKEYKPIKTEEKIVYKEVCKYVSM